MKVYRKMTQQQLDKQQLYNELAEAIDELWGAIITDLKTNNNSETIIVMEKFAPIFGLYGRIRDELLK